MKWVPAIVVGIVLLVVGIIGYSSLNTRIGKLDAYSAASAQWTKDALYPWVLKVNERLWPGGGGGNPPPPPPPGWGG